MELKKIMPYAPYVVLAIVSGVGLWLLYSKYLQSTSPGPIRKSSKEPAKNDSGEVVCIEPVYEIATIVDPAEKTPLITQSNWITA